MMFTNSWCFFLNSKNILVPLLIFLKNVQTIKRQQLCVLKYQYMKIVQKVFKKRKRKKIMLFIFKKRDVFQFREFNFSSLFIWIKKILKLE